jgi:hypothetical protein
MKLWSTPRFKEKAPAVLTERSARDLTTQLVFGAGAEANQVPNPAFGEWMMSTGNTAHAQTRTMPTPHWLHELRGRARASAPQARAELETNEFETLYCERRSGQEVYAFMQSWSSGQR